MLILTPALELCLLSAPTQLKPPLSQFITTTNAVAPPPPVALSVWALCQRPPRAYSSHGRPLQINPRDGNQLISEQNAPATHNALNLPLIKQREASKQLRVCSLMSERGMRCRAANVIHRICRRSQKGKPNFPPLVRKEHIVNSGQFAVSALLKHPTPPLSSTVV